MGSPEAFVEQSVREHAQATAAETVEYWFMFGEAAIVRPGAAPGVLRFYDVDCAKTVAARIEAERAQR